MPGRKNSNNNNNFFSQMNGFQKLLVFVGIPLLAFAFLPMLIAVIIGLLPTITVLITDSRNAYKLTIVGCLNLSGVFFYLFDVIRRYGVSGHFQPSFDVLGLLEMFGAAALGIAIYAELPGLIVVLYKALAKKRVQLIDARLAALRDDWGFGGADSSPSGGAKAPESGK